MARNLNRTPLKVMSHPRREGPASKIIIQAKLAELVAESLLRRVTSGNSRRVTMDSRPGKPGWAKICWMGA